MSLRLVSVRKLPAGMARRWLQGFLLACVFSLNFMGNICTAIAADTAGSAFMEKESPVAEEAPTTCGPLLTDGCIPIGAQKASVQVLSAVGVVGGTFDSKWRRQSAGGDFVTLSESVKLTYGLARNLEVYAVIPYIHNFASRVETAGPNGETSANFGNIGDITAVGKYLLVEETTALPAISGVFGLGFPTGNASHLKPDKLGTDGIGSGAFTFTTGVNLYKWLKPFLVTSNIWFSTPANVYSGSDSIQSQSFVTFNLAAEYPFNKRWAGLLEFYSTWTFKDPSGPQGYQSPSTILGILPGIEFYATENWAFTAGVGIDLAGRNTGYKFTPMISVVYNF